MHDSKTNGSSGSGGSSSSEEGKSIKDFNEDHFDSIRPPKNLILPSEIANNDSNLSDEEPSLVRSKRRIQAFSDSDGDSMIETVDGVQIRSENDQDSQESVSIRTVLPANNNPPSNKIRYKSRLRRMSNTSGEQSDSDHKTHSSSDDEQQSRIRNKRNKLQNKFKTMHAKKRIYVKPNHDIEQDDEVAEKDSDEFHNSEDDVSSIEKNIQIIKEKPFQLKTSLYDPDTSDEETKNPNRFKRKGRMSTKPTSPKPLRMSAKQAMENMQKIKSESNRMLREKDVSLPYHRPKALTLKDIMSRRRAAVTPDGKALPIKMNDEQLKQYVQILEQRQKEVIELCKSDTEDEEKEEMEKTDSKKVELENEPDIALKNDTFYDELLKSEDLLNSNVGSEVLHNNSENDLGKMDVNQDISNEAKLCIDETSCKVNGTNTETNKIFQNSEEINSKVDDSMFVDPILQEDQSNAIGENNTKEMELVYNVSVEEKTDIVIGENDKATVEATRNALITENPIKPSTEVESQLISLHYDTDNNTEEINEINILDDSENFGASSNKNSSMEEISTNEIQINRFSDDDMNIDDIDALIENAEVSAGQIQTNNGMVDSPMLIREPLALTAKPKLTGAPGMVIDLDGTDPLMPKKLSGVELLKERFVFFSKLKTPEELEREREKRIKPGRQHLKLKQELEEQIAEQRSLEWAKRLEEEKQHQKELSVLRGEDSDVEDDIDAIEAKLEKKEHGLEKESSSESEDEEELEQEIEDKPMKRNPMVDDEAEESDCDEDGKIDNHTNDAVELENKEDDADASDESNESEEESCDEPEGSDQDRPKKGRILKAFEDSDDDETPKPPEMNTSTLNNKIIESVKPNMDIVDKQVSKNTQDEELHLAQKSFSEDLFTSQESSIENSGKNGITSDVREKVIDDKELGTQTFSILESTCQDHIDMNFPIPDTLPNTRDTQSYGDSLDAVVGMCSGSFSQTQNLVPSSQTAADVVPVSQVIGDDVLALCTGQFYDNQFVSQLDAENKSKSEETAIDSINGGGVTSNLNRNDCNTEVEASNTEPNRSVVGTENIVYNHEVGKKDLQNKGNNEIKTLDPNLRSILDELNDPDFDVPKSNKYFVSNDHQDNRDKENKQSIANDQSKRKFIIDSDEEISEENTNTRKKKKIKRKKMEQRALQISDDEEEEEEVVEYESELEDKSAEQMVEYDSDENEVVVESDKQKRKMGEFFEQEAELTSEDEWAGSGDEDEAGPDRWEREAGDDDAFDQKQLQRELGQIHMRDVLDQDKREVRLIQEMLFEDADLGAGSRQRKFRWRDADGEEMATGYGEFADTQEEEFESEEQWRKQRHEREVFLRTLKNQEVPEESLNISMSRTTIIKANLAKGSSSLFLDANSSIEEVQSPVVEKKLATAKDIPSPKKPLTMFQQNYPGSLLSRGRGALARLAALASPLADDERTSLKPTSGRNFVFATIDAPNDAAETKVGKRKAENNAGTPRLVKKMRTEDIHKPKSSLLDKMKV